MYYLPSVARLRGCAVGVDGRTLVRFAANGGNEAKETDAAHRSNDALSYKAGTRCAQDAQKRQSMRQIGPMCPKTQDDLSSRRSRGMTYGLEPADNLRYCFYFINIRSSAPNSVFWTHRSKLEQSPGKHSQKPIAWPFLVLGLSRAAFELFCGQRRL